MIYEERASTYPMGVWRSTDLKPVPPPLASPVIDIFRGLFPALAMLLWATDPAPCRPLQASNHEMASLLEHIASAADPAGNEYLNAERALRLRQQLADTLTAGTELEAEIAVRLALGAELLRAGLTEEAIAELEQLREPAGRVRDARSRKLSRRILLDMLGVSYLRLGEQQNCLLAHTSASCILPVSAAGVHVRPRGSRTAISHYGSLLAEHPDDLGAFWLINLAHMTLGEHPQGVPAAWLIPPETFASDGVVGRFRDVAPHSGLTATGLSGGSIMEDFNGDGFLDVMASSWGLRDPLRYFRSNGDGSFSEHTERAGLVGQVGGLNLTHADFDNDGDRDVLVLRGAWLDEHGLHPNSLLQNDSSGFFTDVTRASGLLSFHPTHAAACGGDAPHHRRHGGQLRRPRQRWIPRLLHRDRSPADARPAAEPHVPQRRGRFL